ncbi:cysteine hydrolase [Microcoleus sp. FACHB-SPT15]|uniref:isochorismatase family cysteine hydrolase n=1 Tax=Microcoleus sp. FACHB-SPT15 TaxID=2692830 RepID=UPI0017846738|nr:isochorismatase family cysteine hydrolase [Microcoleus sp. FACHB-SPT15]MBD1804620.1 cysteine hydrolase [Microcoleus sp. FACHB-SPT15]
MSELLIIVDVQVGFINEFTHHIPQRVARLIQRQEYASILFTRFINAPDGPYQQLLDWHSCDSEPEINIVPELEPWVKPERVFSKPGLCGMPNELASYLRKQRIEQVFLVGIDTDMCVLKMAMDVFDIGIEPLILTDCCASTAGLQAHLAGLAVLSRNIGANRLREAGLSEGFLAAPRNSFPGGCED